MSELFNKYKCCGYSSIEHILDAPKQLLCGHYVCSKCPIEQISCAQCGEVNNVDMAKRPIVKSLETIINKTLPNISEEIAKNVKNTIKQIELKKIDLDEKIEKQFEFLSEEIEIRIESLKSKLDEIRIDFNVKLNSLKDNMKVSVFDVDVVEEIKQTFDNIGSNIDVELVNDLNLKCKKIEDELQKVMKFDFKAHFTVNENFEMNDESIGFLKCNYDTPLTSRISSNFEYLQIETQPFRLIQLNNNRNILISSEQDHCLSVYDSNFSLVKETKRINGLKFKPFGLASDIHGNVYVTDPNRKTLIKLDSELNYKCSLEHPKRWQYGDICVYDNKIYACVWGKNYIEQISLDLKQSITFSIEFQPFRIVILNNIACIETSDVDNKIGFYKLPTFDIVFKYDFYGALLAHDKWFYVFQNNTLRSFDMNGNFIETFVTNFGLQTKIYDGICVFNNQLIIALNEKKILKINLK